MSAAASAAALAVRRASRRLTGSSSSGAGAGGADSSTVDGNVLDAVLTPWLEEEGITAGERAARESTAVDMRRAHLHQFRFATEAEEMAWLEEEKTTFDVAALEPPRTLEEGGMDTPSKVWDAVSAKASGTSSGRFDAFLEELNSIGPNLLMDAPISRLPVDWHAPGVLIVAAFTRLRALPDGLQVSRALVLKASRILALPPHLKVEGELVLRSAYLLTALPHDMHVGGSLVAVECPALVEIPANLGETVRGSITFGECDRLTAVPPLHVRGDFVLTGCNGVTSLPEALRVDGSLDLSWSSITSLPWDDLHVRGDLVLRHCSSLTSLPAQLRVDGKLDVSYCHISVLPDGLRVDGDVDLNGLKRLVALPAGFRPRKRLSLWGCRALAALPAGLCLTYLNIAGCDSLAELPCDVVVDGAARLGGGITALPASARLLGDITVQSCSMQLPGDLHVKGDLAILNCEYEALPAGLVVEGDLRVDDCEMLTALPGEARVLGSLTVKWCGRLVGLPATVHGPVSLKRTAVRAIPDTWETVPGDLVLHDCPQLTELPTTLKVVEGGLKLRECPLLAELPATLEVEGSLHVVNTGVTELPWGSSVHVRGDLFLMGALTRLPRDELRVDGRFELSAGAQLTSLPLVLDVGGALTVSDCGIDALPGGMKVGGGVLLVQLRMLAGLHEGLAESANHNLILRDCPLVSALPQGLHVKKLACLECPLLDELPDDLVVEGEFELRRSSVLSLPATARFLGSISLEHCRLLQALPSGLHVRGGLMMFLCSSLTELPEGLQVDGGVHLRGLANLEELPGGLVVKGHFFANHCPMLREVPVDARFDGNVAVSGCAALTLLPDNMHIRGDFDVSASPSLVELPAQLTVDGDLALSNCRGLPTLPACLEVHGDIVATGSGLVELPDHWHARGSMFLKDCEDLAALPAGLTVSGHLSVRNCASLTELPGDDDFHVDGGLSLEGCTGITALPDCVLAWGMCSNGQPHNIRLAGSGLPPEELARLQALDNPALRFHVSMDESFGGGDLAADDFPTLDDAAAFWAKEAGVKGEGLAISPFVEAAYVRGVMGFLSKVRRAKEFNNSLTKAGLAKRVVQVLELLAGEDDGVREELVVRMADAVDTCSDKPMWALNQMQVLVHIAEARGDRDALRALGMGVMRLEVVHRHVRKAMDAMNFVDDVCVYLRFEIALRESLQLPVSALEMLYPSYVTVTDESIAAAEAEALRLAEEDLNAWLPDWSEWQRQDRVEFAEELEFSTLTRNSTKRLSLSLRSLLGSKIADPVRVRPAKAVWSLEDLMKHWINTGMDLNNTPRNVDYMRLNLTKCI